MAYLIGIDIGTSGTKVLAIDETGKVAATAGAEYPLSTPRPLWAEQRAEDWWEATCACLQQVLQVIPAEDVAGFKPPLEPGFGIGTFGNVPDFVDAPAAAASFWLDVDPTGCN